MYPTKRRTFVRGSAASLLALGAAPESMPDSAPQVSKGALSVRVTTLKARRRRLPERTHAGVVVFLEGVPGRVPDMVNEVHEIRQVEQEFVPRVSVVLVGTTLSFPNDDRIFHNVFSSSDGAKFDLGSYKSGSTQTYVPTQTGTIEVFCNLHSSMVAKVLVIDTPFYSMSDDAGYLWIGKVPPGTYDYEAWQAWGETKTGRVTIAPATTTKLALELVTERSSRHQRKDGSDYPRGY